MITRYSFGYGLILSLVGIIGFCFAQGKLDKDFRNTVNNMIDNGAEVYLDGQLIEHPDKLDLDDYKIEIHGDYILLKKPIPMPATINY